jgi:undecaprenyl-diphosphatase
MAIATSVVIALWPVLRRSGRIVAVVVAAAGVVVVGMDRIALGVHFLTDVLAGWAVGLAVVAATTAAFVTPDDMGALRRGRRAHVLTWPRALGRMLARLLAGWLALLTVMVALGLLVTGPLADRWPLSVEDRVNVALEQGRTPGLNSLTLAFRHMADTPVIIITMLVVVVILRLAIGRWRESLFVFAATAGQALVFVATTAFVDRPRPDVERLDASPPTSSFPSGHTSAALALYLAIATVLIRTIQRPWLRRLLAALALLPPLLVAYARLYRGMHHPSDVAGSVVNASACLWLASRVVLSGPLPEDDPHPTVGQDTNRSTAMSGARP